MTVSSTVILPGTGSTFDSATSAWIWSGSVAIADGFGSGTINIVGMRTSASAGSHLTTDKPMTATDVSIEMEAFAFGADRVIRFDVTPATTANNDGNYENTLTYTSGDSGLNIGGWYTVNNSTTPNPNITLRIMGTAGFSPLFFLGADSPAAIRVGNQPVSAVYAGSTRIWEA